MPDWHKYNGGALGDAWRMRSPPENAYFAFSAVRNPFDRLVSAWKYLPNFRDRPLEELLNNLPTEGHDFRHVAVTQSAMLTDPVTRRLMVDDLIRFESLQLDFDRICAKIGKPQCTLEHVNPTRREKGYRQYFTEETRAAAEELFAADLSSFNYEF